MKYFSLLIIFLFVGCASFTPVPEIDFGGTLFTDLHSDDPFDDEAEGGDDSGSGGSGGDGGDGDGGE